MIQPPMRICPECHGATVKRVTAVPGLEPAPAPPAPPRFPLLGVGLAAALAQGGGWVAVNFWRHGRGHALAQAVLIAALGMIVALAATWWEKQHQLGAARRKWEGARKAWRTSVWYCEPCDRVFWLGGAPREREQAWKVAEDAARDRPVPGTGPGGRLAVGR